MAWVHLYNESGRLLGQAAIDWLWWVEATDRKSQAPIQSTRKGIARRAKVILLYSSVIFNVHFTKREPLLFRMIRRGLTISARRLAVRRALFAPVQQRVVNPLRALSVTPRVNLPSHELVPLPALSPTMEVGTIKSWEVNTFKFIVSTLNIFLSRRFFEVCDSIWNNTLFLWSNQYRVNWNLKYKKM